MAATKTKSTAPTASSEWRKYKKWLWFGAIAALLYGIYWAWANDFHFYKVPRYEVVFNRDLGTMGKSWAGGIDPTSDGYYISLGNHLLTKFNENGEILWQVKANLKPNGDNYPLMQVGTLSTRDGGVLMYGRKSYATRPGEHHVTGNINAFARRYDGQGKMLWEREYSNPSHWHWRRRNTSFARGVALKDGYALLGYNGTGIDEHPWVLKLNDRGDIVWQNVLPSARVPTAKYVVSSERRPSQPSVIFETNRIATNNAQEVMFSVTFFDQAHSPLGRGEYVIVLGPDGIERRSFRLPHSIGSNHPICPPTALQIFDFKAYLAEHPEYKDYCLADDGGILYESDRSARHSIGSTEVMSWLLLGRRTYGSMGYYDARSGDRLAHLTFRSASLVEQGSIYSIARTKTKDEFLIMRFTGGRHYLTRLRFVRGGQVP